MKKLTQWIVARCIRDFEKTGNLKVRARYGMLEGWVSIVVNLLLFLVKGGIGVVIGSVALIADAVHTLSDCATSVVVIIGFRISRKPSDREHPFGHGRMESVATIIVSVLLIVSAIELLKSSVMRLIHPASVTASGAVIGVLIATIVIKEVLARFCKHLGELIESKMLEADFWHHRSDVIATALVVLALIGSSYGFCRLDAVGGVVVSAIIAASGYAIAKQAISPLLGQAPPPELLRDIEATAKGTEGVEGVHDVIVHQYGRTNLVSLHIEVSGEEEPTKLHEISEAVERAVGGNMHGTVVVHIDPLNRNHERYQEAERAVGEIVGGHERITSFHDLRIVGRGDLSRAIFDVSVDDKADEQDIYDIKQDVIAQFKEKCPGLDVVVQVEPKYAYNV